MRQKPKDTEVDAYIFIKDHLKALGWDTRNPERTDGGQVYTQNECLSNPEIGKLLGLERPENIIRINDEILWVIEAKRSHAELDTAVREAEDYAEKLSSGRSFKAKFVSGVAGNAVDSFLIKNLYRSNGHYRPIVMNGVETSGLLSPDACRIILESNKPEIAEPPIDEKLFLDRATAINEILHLGAVNPHHRASVMAALLLSMLSDTGPNIKERNPDILISDINTRVKSVLREHGKVEFQPYMNIPLPAAKDNHIKFRQALVDTIQELRNLNIRSAMNSGADWLGAFYEVFLKYANWAQDLGIVLTPRHVTKWAVDVIGFSHRDVGFDPTCGTGGFLVAAFDAVKKSCSKAQLERFKNHNLWGIDQESAVVALAVVNMIFRGDGKNNIIEANCFQKSIVAESDGTLKYSAHTPTKEELGVTRVLMNPPFALKRGNEKEYSFVNHALKQMEDGGLLFSVLPYPSMVKPSTYRSWRKELLKQNSLLSVITFPPDLFYPVGVHTVGIFVKKGIPHPAHQNVLWVRAINDGLLKSKGKRLPNPKAENDLQTVRETIRAFLASPATAVNSIERFQKAAPIDFSDPLFELVPENYLDDGTATEAEMRTGMEDVLRNAIAAMVQTSAPNATP